MTIESQADREAFMSVFGVPVTISGSSITAIYDAPSLQALGVTTTNPILTCITTDISGVSHGTSVVVQSIPFSGTVVNIEHDGTGMSVLTLRRQ